MHVPVVIVGAGQAGLAMSRHLTDRCIEHVLLERGEVASSWRSERWDSLRLLTPNWMTRLPGQSYIGPDPDGFMAAGEVVEFLDRYRRAIEAPVQTGVDVERITPSASGFAVQAVDAEWTASTVVVASGASSEPRVPAISVDLPSHLEQLTAKEYRNPAQLEATGRVLVVGASASGVQIADELRRAGREVTIAVGEHIRVPRRYRGIDIYRWLELIGQLGERYDEVDDLERARRHASLQLVGDGAARRLDLDTLRRAGVEIVGKLMACSGTTALCSGGLPSLVANADLKCERLLARIDEHIEQHDLTSVVGPTDAPPRTSIGDPPTELDLRSFGVVVWATGYRPTFPFLPDEAFDARRRPAHDGGVGRLPGLYFLGLTFMRRRSSNLIAGVGEDAGELAGVIADRLARGANNLVRVQA
jgi:putative flavoprotein involved in K+ transport